MLRWGLPLVAALVLAAGCGGSTASSAAVDLSIVPADAVLHASVSSDLDSDQWNRLESLIGRFPAGDDLVAKVREELAAAGLDFEEDVAPALGPTVELVVLEPSEDGVVFLTQPDDLQALRDALAEADDEPPVVEQVGDWAAVAQEQATIDRYRSALDRGTLEGDERYAEATAGLPEDALARLYVDAGALAGALPQGLTGNLQVETLGAALVVRDDGIALEGRTRLPEGAELPQPGALVERVPESAFAFVAFGGGAGGLDLAGQLSQSPQLRQALEAAEAQLGVDVEALAALLGGGGVLYLAPGTLIPEVTLVLEPEDADAAVETLDALVGRLGQAPQRSDVRGVDARVVKLGGLFSLYYGAADGRVVVSTAPDSLAGPPGGSIADDGDYEDALEAAGVEEGEQVSLYVDVDEVLRLAEQAAGLAGSAGGLPQEVRENLEHLSTLVVASGVDGRTATGRVFLGVD